MPALLTHHLFGDTALPQLPTGLVAGEDQRAAFLLGNQGPDPFFFAVTTARGASVRSMGHLMHSEHMAASFEVLRASVERLPEADRGVGRAFVCGMLGHYVLDRTAHPFVYAQEFALCDDSAELHDAYHEVHALIESDIDAAMLRRLKEASVREFAPVRALDASPRVLRAAGALLAQCASVVYGLPLRATDYANALGDMRLCYRAIEPAGSRRSRRLGAAERTVRAHSQLEALAHRVDIPADAPALNPGRLPWVDPFGGETYTDSFVDRFEEAGHAYHLLLTQLLDGADTRQITRGLDYEGRQLGADEGPLPPDPARPL